jgi:hypothetical protein
VIELKCWNKLAKLSWRPFEEAREFARNLGLSGDAQWRAYCNGKFPETTKLPADIPASPAKVYRIKGWIGWGDWLGTGTIATQQRLLTLA